MIFDFCARGELYEIVSGADDGKLEVSTTRDYLTQIASGVHFMHSNGFAHRDLSLENVLVTDDNTCKVCDFGLAAVADQPSNETVGKMFYMAPEVLSGSAYDPKKADVWSLGVMLFIMLFGAPPVESAALTDARFKIISSKGIRHLIGRWGLTESVPAEAIDLIEGMIQVDPRRRMSIDLVLAHAFLNANVARPCVVDCVEDCSSKLSTAAPASVVAVKENRLASKLQRLFRRSSKRRIMDVSASQTTVVA
ncbi:hypothetical protein P43SY_011086 [Pythium insidiosum]|uniref:Protein kinase domain-containing protein n=1 Tax=Pythium insidiosum TaxID=114742 RepID=A0AAD5LS48_PYTIN|nr:hypothetical protein P43SY_011086 [Pythium insidiosum]